MLLGAQVAAQVLPDLELLQVAFAQSTYRVLPILLRVSFFAFPAVSSLAFKAFRCDDLDLTDDQLAFNRQGRRFRLDAGQ